MKLYLETFRSNGVKLEDVIFDFETGVDSETGIHNVFFKTKDKYVDVTANTSLYSPNGISGRIIRVMPYISIDSVDDIEEMKSSTEYYAHPDYFMAEILVPNPEDDEDESYAEIVSPLKNAYTVTYIPWKYIHKGNMKKTELIHLE